MSQEQWLALNLGNSRLHMATFTGKVLQNCWDYDYDRLPETVLDEYSQILIASVNPHRLTAWHKLPHSRILALSDVPLPGTYGTMGIDRALAAWGAISHYGAPVLVIDCGTAITLTAIDGKGEFVGGAIFPGLELLCNSLPERVPHLPLIHLDCPLPSLWAKTTETALQSGIGNFVAAGLAKFIADRGCLTVFTGGDGAYWQKCFSDSIYDPHLVFLGMAEL